MAENINGQDLLGSGGHKWLWGSRDQAAKELTTVGVDGATRFVMGNYARPVEIVSRLGGRPQLKGRGSSKDLADSDLNAQIEAIEALVRSGTPVAWEDDEGHSGAALVLTGFDPGLRQYGQSGGEWIAIAQYSLRGREMEGAW